MRLFATAIFIAAFLISPSAYARDVTVGSSTLSVSPPAGFCEVDKANKADSSWVTSVTNLLNSVGIYLIAAFPDCRELKKLEESNQFIITKVYISAFSSAIGKSSSRTAADTCNDLRTRTYSEQQKTDLAKAAKEFANGNSLAESKALGVLEETKGEVCYVATLQKVQTSAGDIVTMLGLIAVTNARDNLLFLYQYTLYADATSIPSALANLKSVYSDFVAANTK
jgi:hypothetical protein